MERGARARAQADADDGPDTLSQAQACRVDADSLMRGSAFRTCREQTAQPVDGAERSCCGE